MKSKVAPEDSLEPQCTWMVFECFSPKNAEPKSQRLSIPFGIEREMRIMYQQPHLVPPMKLTKFDDLPPPTPPPAQGSQLSQWMSQGKATVRASLSIKRHTSARPSISSPRPPVPAPEVSDLPLRRPAAAFRPLELSIYLPQNRLSNLPEFDRLSFTEVGEIKLPPRALMRPRSEEIVPSTIPLPFAAPKPASMIEHRQLPRFRPDTSSTVIPVSRPPSEYDALHSHPVSWASLPGLPPSVHMPGIRSESSVKVLTPMQEEFTPPATAVTIGEVALVFPKDPEKKAIEEGLTREPEPMLSAAKASAPAPDVPLSNTRNFSRPPTAQPANDPNNFFHPNYQTQQRISQWLAHRRHSSSISTVKTSSTTTSFADHRRKRSEFYQLGRQAPPPKPLSLWPKTHQRTMTASTVASTVETDILSFDGQSQADTNLTTPLQSRSGTVKSNSKPLRPIMSGVPDVPPCYAEVIAQAADELLIKEIGGPLRSPGVGVAF